MDALKQFVDFLLHAEGHVRWFIENYGMWVYALLFGIIFAETGFVVTPFLPGDSLLFAVGALAAQGMMNPWILCGSLIIAAVSGNTVNYSIGRWLGPKVFHFESNMFFKKEYLMRAHAFYEKYGGRAVVLSRFVPIIRTFAPFVAGIGTMSYGRFALFNIVGAVLWVGCFVGAGYFFGTWPAVKSNMKMVMLGIIVVSLLPVAWEWWRATREKKSATP